MKKFFWISGILSATILITACSDVRRKPGAAYMPDMAYSVALETYASPDSARFTNRVSERGEGKVYYTGLPVAGTIARGDNFSFRLTMDKMGDSTNYVASKQVKNPLPKLDVIQMKEAERLYLVNCAICHGPKLDGNGPLYKGGAGPYIAKPATLVGDAKYEAMPEGQMFYSVTYGKNMMGSYASQLSTNQRWMVIHYVKAKQAAKPSAPAAGATPAAGDSMAAKKDTATTK